MSMPKILKLKITLIDSNPQIWREVLIEKDKNFEDLHYTIQGAMNWKNYHIHEFPLTENKYIGGEPPSPYSRKNRSYLKESNTKIEKFLNKKGDSIKYIYDFGDYWRHKIEVIDVLEQEDNREYPVCIDGENASPPEDVGGINGYKRMVEAFSDVDHPDYETYKEWLGD